MNKEDLEDNKLRAYAKIREIFGHEVLENNLPGYIVDQVTSLEEYEGNSKEIKSQDEELTEGIKKDFKKLENPKSRGNKLKEIISERSKIARTDQHITS